MATQGDLEQAVRRQFPLLFDDQAAVSTADFQHAYNAVAEYAVAAARPALQPETHKQQWLLASASIGLIALIFFKVGELKVADVQVAVDGKVLIWYAVFLALLLASFLLRAWLDIRRAGLAREVDADRLYRLQNLVEAATTRRNLQLYHWLELCHQIELRYAAYDRAQSTAPSSAPFEPSDLRVLQLDTAALKQREAFRAEVESHERFVDGLVRQLEADSQRFQDKVAEHDHPLRPRTGTSRRFSAVSDHFDRYLGPWFAMRNATTDLLARQALDRRERPEMAMLSGQLALLKKTRAISRLYLFTEIALPSLLALSALAYAMSTLCGGGDAQAPASAALTCPGTARPASAAHGGSLPACAPA